LASSLICGFVQQLICDDRIGDDGFMQWASSLICGFAQRTGVD
jgi:hypothetical protein